MKVGVVGDLHYGAGYNLGRVDPDTQLNSRLLDYVKTFNAIVDSFVDRGVQVLILTGDIFETRHPTSAQLNAFSKCIRRATDLGLDIHIVVGNHDQQRSINTSTVDIFGSLKLDRVSVYPNIERINIDGINIVLMPYRDRRMLGTKTNSEAIKLLDEEVNNLIKDISGFKMLVGHLMLENTMGEDNPDSFSINELILPLSMFNDFDAVVMGHVHRHNVLSQSNPIIMYSGSMEKVSFGEKAHKKVSLIIDTKTKKAEIIRTKVRNIYEMEFDYSSKVHKNKINEFILKDINDYNKANNLADAIVKLIARVSEHDLYFVDQEVIRNAILDKKVSCLYNIQIIAAKSRQLRNAAITEDISIKQAMATFIQELSEPDPFKQKMLKHANDIINEVEGK